MRRQEEARKGGLAAYLEEKKSCAPHMSIQSSSSLITALKEESTREEDTTRGQCWHREEDRSALTQSRKAHAWNKQVCNGGGGQYSL